MSIYPKIDFEAFNGDCSLKDLINDYNRTCKKIGISTEKIYAKIPSFEFNISKIEDTGHNFIYILSHANSDFIRKFKIIHPNKEVIPLIEDLYGIKDAWNIKSEKCIVGTKTLYLTEDCMTLNLNPKDDSAVCENDKILLNHQEMNFKTHFKEIYLGGYSKIRVMQNIENISTKYFMVKNKKSYKTSHIEDIFSKMDMILGKHYTG